MKRLILLIDCFDFRLKKERRCFCFLSVLFLVGLFSVSGCTKPRDSSPFSTNNKTVSDKTVNDKTAKSKTVKKKVVEKRTWDPEGVEDFSLTTCYGKTVRKADLLGKPWIVGFIFTRCAGQCRDVTFQMYELQTWLEEQKIDAKLVTLAVDPEFDSLEKLKTYAKRHGAEAERWCFLTGSKKEIYRLINKSFDEDVRENPNAKPGDEIFHTASLMLVDEKGRVIGSYDSTVEELVARLKKRLLKWKKTGSF